jgi:hypothetical protein
MTKHWNYQWLFIAWQITQHGHENVNIALQQWCTSVVISQRWGW